MPEVFGAIHDKWQKLRGEGVDLGAPVNGEQPTFDGIGRAQDFAGGRISWHPDIREAFATWGLILQRFKEIGGEAHGYPITDESGCPDGLGRYNHFRAMHLPGRPESSIYWAPGIDLAHEVYGGIRERWSAIGWERSSLGYPTGPEGDTAEGGRVQTFQGGNMFWWSDTGAREVGDIVVRYRGMICFSEDDMTGSDEPYVIVGVAAADGLKRPTFLRQYSDVDAGGSFPEATEIYRGLPTGVTLSVTLMEQDEGDPASYRDKVNKFVADAIDKAGLGTAAIPVVGPAIAPVVTQVLKELAPDIAEELVSWLADELVGTHSIPLSQKQLCGLVASPVQREQQVEFHISTNLLSNGAASYKAYFDVARV